MVDNLIGYLFINVVLLGIVYWRFSVGHKLGIIWKLVSYLFFLGVCWLSWEVSGLLTGFIDLSLLSNIVSGPITSVINKFFNGFSQPIEWWNRALVFGIVLAFFCAYYVLKQPVKTWASKSSLKFPLSFTIGGIIGLVEGFIILLMIYFLCQKGYIPGGLDIIRYTILKFLQIVFDGMQSILGAFGF